MTRQDIQGFIMYVLVFLLISYCFNQMTIVLPFSVLYSIISCVKFSLFSFSCNKIRCLSRCHRHVIILRKYFLWFHELPFSGHLIYIFAFWKIDIIQSFTFTTTYLLMYFSTFWCFSDVLNPLVAYISSIFPTTLICRCFEFLVLLHCTWWSCPFKISFLLLIYIKETALFFTSLTLFNFVKVTTDKRRQVVTVVPWKSCSKILKT